MGRQHKLLEQLRAERSRLEGTPTKNPRSRRRNCAKLAELSRRIVELEISMGIRPSRRYRELAASA